MAVDTRGAQLPDRDDPVLPRGQSGDLDIVYDAENADVADYKADKTLVTSTSPTMGISDFLIQTRIR